jgi:hypothetical protein
LLIVGFVVSFSIPLSLSLSASGLGSMEYVKNCDKRFQTKIHHLCLTVDKAVGSFFPEYLIMFSFESINHETNAPNMDTLLKPALEFDVVHRLTANIGLEAYNFLECADSNLSL